MPAVVKLPRTRHVRRIPIIVEEVRHALTQLDLQSRYPGRPEPPELPQSEWSPYPSAFDDEE
jgi:hypothetical protein